MKCWVDFLLGRKIFVCMALEMVPDGGGVHHMLACFTEKDFVFLVDDEA